MSDTKLRVPTWQGADQQRVDRFVATLLASRGARMTNMIMAAATAESICSFMLSHLHCQPPEAVEMAAQAVGKALTILTQLSLEAFPEEERPTYEQLVAIVHEAEAVLDGGECGQETLPVEESPNVH